MKKEDGLCFDAKDEHYSGYIQPIELMQEQMKPAEFMAYLRGNIIKYCSRFGKKTSNIEDEARKIEKYAQWLHEVAKGQKIHI